MANGNQQPTFAGQKVSPAMARAVSAFSASLEAEGKRRADMGLSGAGFAAGFKEAVSPITDYSDMLEGNAAPGTVLFDAAINNAVNKNKTLESRGIDSEDKAFEVDDGDDGGVPDLLARPVETEEADVVPNTIRQAIEEGTVELPEGFKDKPEFSMLAPQTFEQVVAMTGDFGPDPKVGMTRNDPRYGMSYDDLARGKSYRLPGANTPAAYLRYGPKGEPQSPATAALKERQTSPEMRDKGMTRVSPQAVGSAPQNLIEGGVMGALFQQASPKSDQARESLPSYFQDLKNSLFRLRREGRSYFGMDDR